MVVCLFTLAKLHNIQTDEKRHSRSIETSSQLKSISPGTQNTQFSLLVYAPIDHEQEPKCRKKANFVISEKAHEVLNCGSFQNDVFILPSAFLYYMTQEINGTILKRRSNQASLPCNTLK